MQKPRWWTVETTFVVGIGIVMASAFGTSFFARQGSQTGSALVPATTLQKLIINGGECQTITDEDVFN
jgi:hypothetical protein